MDRVVRVSFILLTTRFTLIFAGLIADRTPQPRAHPLEFGGKGANMLSTSLPRTILL